MPTPDPATEPPMLLAAPGPPAASSVSTSTGGEIRVGGELAELAGDLSFEMPWWPNGHEAVARARVWMDAGWTFADLTGMLTDRVLAVGAGNPPGLIRSILRCTPDKPPRIGAPVPGAESPTCDICNRTELECRRVATKLGDPHDYQPDPDWRGRTTSAEYAAVSA